MGLHPRAIDPLTYEQMVKYESSHIKWFKFYGYVTNMKELADIFAVPHCTLLTRLKSKWPIEAALLADTKTQWTKNNIHFFVNHQMDVAAIYEKLEAFFEPKSSKKKKSNKRVIDGGFF